MKKQLIQKEDLINFLTFLVPDLSNNEKPAAEVIIENLRTYLTNPEQSNFPTLWNYLIKVSSAIDKTNKSRNTQYIEVSLQFTPDEEAILENFNQIFTATTTTEKELKSIVAKFGALKESFRSFNSLEYATFLRNNNLSAQKSPYLIFSSLLDFSKEKIRQLEKQNKKSFSETSQNYFRSPFSSPISTAQSATTSEDPITKFSRIKLEAELNRAITAGLHQLVENYLNQGVDPNQTDNFGNSGLHWLIFFIKPSKSTAFLNNALATINILFSDKKYGAKINILNHENKTPLDLANDLLKEDQGILEQVRQTLQSHGAKTANELMNAQQGQNIFSNTNPYPLPPFKRPKFTSKYPSNPTSFTPIRVNKEQLETELRQYAAEGNHEAVKKLLTEYPNLDLNAKGEDGYAALHLVILSVANEKCTVENAEETISVLHKHKANMDLFAKRNIFPFVLANEIKDSTAKQRIMSKLEQCGAVTPLLPDGEQPKQQSFSPKP